MNKSLIAAIIAAVALLAVGGVVALNNKSNNAAETSGTNTNASADDTSGDDSSKSDDDNSGSGSNNSGHGSGGMDPGAGDDRSPAATSTVNIKDFAFTPGNITVKKGTKVTWTNNDSVAHTVTGDTAGGPDSELLSNGESYSFTFNTVGTFTYHCAPHPQMTGKVIVTE